MATYKYCKNCKVVHEFIDESPWTFGKGVLYWESNGDCFKYQNKLAKEQYNRENPILTV